MIAGANVVVDAETRADHALARKMARNVKRVVERHPLGRNLRPTRADEWASDRFTVARDAELRDPSVLARGIGASTLSLTARVNNLFDARYTTFGYMDGEALYIPAASRNVFVGFSVGL